METRYGELTESERRQIFRLRLARISRSEIGRMIGRDKDKRTISRELRRNVLLEKRLSKLHQPNDALIPQTALVRIERLLDWLKLVS
jgi:IS30 family transposase